MKDEIKEILEIHIKANCDLYDGTRIKVMSYKRIYSD